MTKHLYFLPLGGAGEIGMNLNLYGWGTESNRQWIMIDLGVTFGDNRVPGVDLITPDPSFIEERKNKLRGIVLTHAHEDHLGAVPYIWERLGCKIFATSFTISILKNKLKEFHLLDKVQIQEIPLNSKFSVGPFDLEFISITHSIPEPNSVVINTPAGIVYHTGDWKFDPKPITGEATNHSTLKQLGNQGVKAIICDSTNVFSSGHSGSEGKLEKNLYDIIKNCSGRVVVACFASNVARLTSIARAAKKSKRKVVLSGRSLWRINDAARSNGYLHGIEGFTEEEKVKSIDRENLLIICTGSQGEPRAALSRIASGAHRHISLEAGDTAIFSSKIIPGNERAINELQNSLIRNGIEVLTEKDASIHVSGHPNQDELIKMYEYIKPEISIPVHGEIRHLKRHAAVAKQCNVKHTFVIENGCIVKLAPGKPKIVETVPSGRLSYEGNRLVPFKGQLIRHRNRVLYHGSAVITAIIGYDGKLIMEPQISTTGLLEHEDETIIEEVLNQLKKTIGTFPIKSHDEDHKLAEALRLSARRTFQEKLNKRPIVKIHFARI